MSSGYSEEDIVYPTPLGRAFVTYIILSEERLHGPAFLTVETIRERLSSYFLEHGGFQLDENELTAKTIRRYLEAVRAATGRVEAKRGSKGGYRLSSLGDGYEGLDPLERELFSVFMPTSVHIRRKLALSLGIPFENDAVQNAMAVKKEALEKARTFLTAIASGKAVSFSLGRQSYVLSPMLIFAFKRTFYLVGKDNGSGKVSAYNIMAVSSLAVEDGKLSATSRPDYAPWVDESAFGIHRTEKKRIEISFAASSKDERLVNELFEGKAQLRNRGENECVYSLPVYSLEEAASNLLNIQRGVKILDPEELRGIYLAKARAMAGAIAKKNKK